MLLTFLVGAALAAQSVSLKTEDGKTLAASVEKASGAKRGVVLVHGAGRSSLDWSTVATRLAKSNMTAITPDLRGHGKSAAQAPTLGEQDYLAMVNDVRAAVAWLRANGVTEVSCVGANLGANLCLQVANEDKAIANLALLSPGLNLNGVKASFDGYGDRPVLFVASTDDSYSAKSVSILEPKAAGQHHSEIFDAAGSGTKMLAQEAGLEGTLVSWLLGTFQLASGEMVLPKVEVQGSTQSIETTGQKLDIHR